MTQLELGDLYEVTMTVETPSGWKRTSLFVRTLSVDDAVSRVRVEAWLIRDANGWTSEESVHVLKKRLGKGDE